jgi:serine/arginine repetitive matrix protein 2
LPAPSSQRPSDGQLNRSFIFGSLPRSQSSLAKDEKQPLTLSDIIPPSSHVRSLSSSTSMDEDDSVLNSIFSNITGVQGRSRALASSGASAPQIAHEKRRSIYKAMSQPSSGISFTGFDSFDEVWHGFEFSDERPAFYPPPPSAATRHAPHRRHESTLSIISVSSYIWTCYQCWFT